MMSLAQAKKVLEIEAAAVAQLAKRRRLYMRDAAYVIAVNRVATACRDRGWV